MIERADSDGDGLVTFEDFFNILTKRTFSWFSIINYNLIMTEEIFNYENLE